MSLFETLMTWPPERLAKELQGQARENAALKRRLLELEVQLFWMKAADAVREWPAGGTLGSVISDPASTANTIGETTCGVVALPAPGGFGVVAARPRTPAEMACWCQTCRPITMDDMRMVLCPTCGNKRCPHANDHNNDCTDSNEPGQPGSSYPARPLPKETPP